MNLSRLTKGALLAAFAGLTVAAMPAPAMAGGQNHCPPGLAKKNPPCVPPGLARKFYPGDIFPRDIDYRRIYYGDYRLPRPQPGYFYAEVGGDLYLVAEATRRVIEAINLMNAAAQ